MSLHLETKQQAENSTAGQRQPRLTALRAAGRADRGLPRKALPKHLNEMNFTAKPRSD